MEARQALIPSLAPIGGSDISVGPPLNAPTPFSDADQNILIEALPNPQDRADLHLRRLKARRDQAERLTFLRRYGPKLEDFGDIASIEDLVEKASQRRIAGG